MGRVFRWSRPSELLLTAMDKQRFTVSPVSETSLLVLFNEPVGVELSLYIAACGAAVNAHFADMVANTVPSYNALLVTLRPSAAVDCTSRLQELLLTVPRKRVAQQRDVIEIPTWYAPEVAEYLPDILEQTGCGLEELIALHTGREYFVYMIGFCPGFAYMGDLPTELRLPRRTVPQTRIPAGSVALADFQTAVYPLAMPGGWNIVGRTPLVVFDASRKQPSLLQQGDMVRFTAIDKQEYLQRGGVL
ncbi:MAG: allophanate hydrolase [Deltaproteobacteria bacterium]|nr:MAG: allophanate hydrolase [Deltaproteobacteria bacterium]